MIKLKANQQLKMTTSVTPILRKKAVSIVVVVDGVSMALIPTLRVFPAASQSRDQPIVGLYQAEMYQSSPMVDDVKFVE